MKTAFSLLIIMFVVNISFGQSKSVCTVGNCEDGFGTYIWGDDSQYSGDKYTGYWKGGMRDGQGTYTWSNSEKYTGSFVQNRFSGYGTMYWSNGDKFEGYWENSKRNGQGTYTYADGSTKTGSWKDNEYIDASTSSAKGCITGNCTDGYGIYVWDNGEKYEGFWKNDHRSGQGTNYFVSGEKYIGEWKDDLRSGHGTNYYKDGTVKTGSWKDDKFVGESNTENNESKINNNNYSAGNLTMIASGTGFALSSDGYIATNNHVIEGAKAVKVRGINEDFQKTYSATIMSTDVNNDLAIIKIDDAAFTNLGELPYTFNTKTSDVGTSVFVLGYPMRASMGDEIKLTNGIISSKTGFKGDITTYQISAPIQAGNSGGPLFDATGNLIGVINAKHTQAENASYAIKVSYLTSMIESLLNPPVLPAQNKISAKPLTEQVKQVKKFIYILEIY